MALRPQPQEIAAAYGPKVKADIQVNVAERILITTKALQLALSPLPNYQSVHSRR